MNRSLKQALELELLPPLPEQPQPERKKSNAEILKPLIEFYKGGENHGR